MMSKKTVNIIGAGIGGPILAIQLKHIGYDVEIFESRAPRSESEEGSFLGITPNGLNILKAFVPLERLKEDFTPGSMRFFNQQGAQIGELRTEYQRKKYGCETLQVKRAHLNQLVRNAAETAGVTIHYGMKCINVRERNQRGEIEFENGSKTECDIVIGSDGTFSTVRSALFPSQKGALFTRNISTGGYARLPGLDTPLDAIMMTFGERGFFAYSVSNRGEIWWFNNYYREKEPTKLELESLLKEEMMEKLLEIHKNDSPIFSEIIKASQDVILFPVFDIPRLNTWFKGPVCLIGDAAHATSPHVGQGASLALEDTVVLANFLRESGAPNIAFRRFQEARQKRVERIIRGARKVGNAKSKPNPLATWLRDRMLSTFVKQQVRKLDWVYGFIP